MPRELTLPSPDGHTYSIGTLNALDQWKIAKRFIEQSSRDWDAWVLSERNAGREPNRDNYFQPAVPVMFSRMSDENSIAVIGIALGVVQRRQDQGGWSPLLTPGTKLLQFADMRQEAMIALTFAVIQDNIESFFPLEQQNTTVAPQA